MILAATDLGDALDRLGVVAAAVLAAAALLAPGLRARSAAAIGALVLVPILLLADIWDSSQVVSLRDRPALLAGAAVVALAVVAALAVLLHRRPLLLPLLVVAALPFRIPISAGGDTANLLVPLYLVIAAGVLAVGVPRLRAEDDDAPFRPRALEWLLCAAIVLYAVQAIYSDDFTHGLQNVVFFYVPFALLFGLLREVPWTQRLALQCLAVLVALAAVFVCIGFVEYARKELLLNPKLVAASQFQTYFRVNSLFFDPNIYGRFLVIVMLGITTVILWTRRARDVLIGAALLALLWAGLVLSFSQSSFAALLAGLAVLAALRWSWRWTAAAVAAAVVVAIGFVVLFPSAINLDLGSSKSADKATSGRLDLIKGGGRLFADKPVLGWGSGSFSTVYRREEGVSSQKAATASHTIPVTVAAEQGVIGLAVYLALLVAALARLFAGARPWPLRAYVAAAFVALLVHTMLYAAFLEDPLTWALLAAGTAFAAAFGRGRDDGMQVVPEGTQAGASRAEPQ
ncbi:MAG: O-antigen ligase family protein [Solirubrobacterales bacterium]